jgi:hypothetical protein
MREHRERKRRERRHIINRQEGGGGMAGPGKYNHRAKGEGISLSV